MQCPRRIPTAGFDEADREVGVAGELRGDGTARGPCTDDHDVELHCITDEDDSLGSPSEDELSRSPATARDVKLPADSVYRPDIDGLRAMAIIPVLVFHLFPEWLPGGYLGVDVFFVISGYLITAILLREMAAGEFRIGRFWARRIRRVVPALVVVTAATLLVARVTLFPSSLRPLAEQAVAALGSVANVYLWRATGNYWGEQAAEAPFLHTWSLAVEEQFYMLFPFVLMAIWRFARPTLLPVLVALTIGSFIVFCIGLARAPAATFYLLPARAWELGVGACLAAMMRVARPRGDGYPLHAMLACAALIAIVGSYVLVPRMSTWTAVPVVGSALVIAGGGSGACGWLLSWPALAWIGRLSYSLYLWHWPILVLAPRIVPGVSHATVLLGTVACSILTYVLVEQPARHRPGILPAIGGAFAVVAGFALWMLFEPTPRYDVEAFEKPHSSIRMYDVRPQPPPMQAAFRNVFAEADAPPTLATPESYATDGIVAGPGSDDPSIVVFGDSHGSMFAETLRAAAEQLGQRIAFYCMNSGMPPYIDMPVERRAPNKVLNAEQRYRFDVARLRAIETWRPRVVVLCARWSIYSESGSPFFDELARRGIAVLLVEQPPELAAVGDNSVVQFLRWKGVSPAPEVECTLPQGNVARVEAGRNRLREIASRYPDCRVLPTADLFTRGDRALVLDGRTVLYLDDDHLTSEGARLALPRITAALADALQ